MTGKPIPAGVSADGAGSPAFSKTSTVDYRSGHATGAPAPHPFAPYRDTQPMRETAGSYIPRDYAHTTGYLPRNYAHTTGYLPRDSVVRPYAHATGYLPREDGFRAAAPVREPPAPRARPAADIDSLTASLSQEVMRNIGAKQGRGEFDASAPTGDVVVKVAQPAAAQDDTASMRRDIKTVQRDLKRAMNELVLERGTKAEITKAMSAIVSRLESDKTTTNKALGIVADKLAAHKTATTAQLQSHATKYASAGEHQKLVGLLAEIVGKMEKGKLERAQTASAVRDLAKQVTARSSGTALDADAVASLAKKRAK